ncbi:Ada metal-binding domain-containing protein [Klebsiella pneumoniae]|uniref:Ada metal-binding domain-containing protein n=1 Tax=Klebsiella pneumoniae TaxID=573 RepID=UPI00388E7BB3
MKITDSMQCDIWYQALLERAVEFTGVFFVGVKTTGVFCISVCRARKPRRETSNFIMTLNPRWMPASGHAKSVARRRMPGRPPPLLNKRSACCEKLQRSASAIASYVSTILARNAFAAGSCKTTGSPFRLFNGCSV